TDDIEVDRFDLPVGGTLVLFTDGIDEARDANGAFFDPALALSGDLPADPEALLDTLLAAVSRHTGGTLQDDAAVLAVTLGPRPRTAPGPRRVKVPRAGIRQARSGPSVSASPRAVPRSRRRPSSPVPAITSPTATTLATWW